MTRDDIIRMAREADPGFEGGEDCDGTMTDSIVGIDQVLMFAALVAAAEREACAKVCEEIEDYYQEHESLRYAELKTDAQTGASDCAHRIRARGDA